MAHDGVTITRDALAEVLRRLGAQPRHIVVGVLGSKASETHRGPADEPPPKKPPTVAEVASWNHFGTSRIPARPFLTIAFEKYGDEIRAIQKRIAKGVVTGKLDLEQGLELLGLEAVARVKQTIIEHVPPPNADSTIARKGSSTPLVHTSQLLGAITHVVRDGR